MKILLFLPNYIGDVLMTTPAIRILKNTLKNSTISAVTKNSVKEVIYENPYIDKFIFKNNSKLKFIQRIISEKFDYAVLFRTTFFNSLATYFAKPTFSVGIDEEFSKFFLSKVIKKNILCSYRYECLNLVGELFNYLGIKYNFNIEEVKKLEYHGWNKIEIKKTLEQKLLQNKIELNKPLIILSPFASRQTKILHTSQYIEIINMLYENNKDIEVILTGQIRNEIEKEMLTTILKYTDSKTKSLCGKINLKELGLLFKISKLVITADSGPAYIAESVGAKTVIFFTSTLPERYGPFSDNVKFIYSSVNCSPCYKNKCPNKTYKCISQIKPEDIVNIVKQFV
ncbi:MAG: glycosyltransferase family 9 protein [Endomicrobia bacterium]|nr:glycosyltransferase family 9 protein [Endomicrobiia bacterium]